MSLPRGPGWVLSNRFARVGPPPARRSVAGSPTDTFHSQPRAAAPQRLGI